MSNMQKWWKEISFWTKLKGTLATLGIGSEIALFTTDFGHEWKLIAAAATITGMLITNWMEDKNNNGIVDLFEKNKKKKNGQA